MGKHAGQEQYVYSKICKKYGAKATYPEGLGDSKGDATGVTAVTTYKKRLHHEQMTGMPLLGEHAKSRRRYCIHPNPQLEDQHIVEQAEIETEISTLRLKYEFS